MAEDAKSFTHKELLDVINDGSKDLLCRRTALYMIGCQWTNDALNEVYELILKYNALSKNIDELLSYYQSPYAIEIAKKLYDKKLIGQLAFDIIESANSQTTYCKTTTEYWGKAVFKSED